MSRPEVPKFVDLRVVAEGYLNKYFLKYEMPDGEMFEYEAVSRKGLEEYRAILEAGAANLEMAPDAVCIVPVLPDGNLVMIREFRYAINSWIVAFPAGLMEPGESILENVERELIEEVGCRVRRDADEPVHVLPQSSYSSVGMTEENVQVVFAQVERVGEPDLEPTEFIEQFELAPGDVADFLDKNTEPIGTRAQLILEAMR